MKSVEPLHLIAAMTLVIVVAIAVATTMVIKAVIANRRCMQRRRLTPEYWRMYARVCESAPPPRRELQRVPNIHDLP